MDSILTSIKKLLGLIEEDEHFDTDLIIHINSVLNILNQMGVGPTTGFSISDKTAVWTDFISRTDCRLEFVKTYIHLKVKLIFDPPTSSSVAESMNTMIKELEWRIFVTVDVV